MKVKRVWAIVAAGALLLASGAVRATPTVISDGYSFPFTISQAPASFGTYAGSFFIPDITTGDIKVMPQGGGAPTVFQHVDANNIRGGLFLPSSFGAYAGQYAQLSVIPNPNDPTGQTAVGRVTAYDKNGNATILATGPDNPGTLFDPAIAPTGFGDYGGQLFMTSQLGGGGILRVDPAGNLSVFSPTPQVQVPGIPDPVSINSTGIVFAPPGFGSVGGMLLTNDVDFARSVAYIIALDPQGNASLFATIPLGPGEFAPRQMAFAPADFGPYAGMLFLSIASSNDNSGTLGAVDAIDQFGNDVATLVQGSDVEHFNPRGLLFQPGGELLISDASDPIYLATASDFRPQVPEPATWLLLCAGIAALFFSVRRRRRG